MTKAHAAPVAAGMLILLTLLNTYLILRGKDENTKRAGETRSIAVNNCRNIATLAKVERAFINRQEAQTQALLTSGVTFGIPKAQLPKLIDASRKSQALFLRDLDALTLSSCATGSAASTPIVRPSKAKPKRATGRAAVPASPATPMVGGTTVGRSPRTVAERRKRPGATPPTTVPVVPSAPTATPSASPTANGTPAPPPVSPAPPPVLPPHITVPVPCVRTPVLTTC